MADSDFPCFLLWEQWEYQKDKGAGRIFSADCTMQGFVRLTYYIQAEQQDP